MEKQILWLDNDPTYIEPYVKALRDKNYKVTVVTTVTEAEAAINNHKYHLLILDVMIPTFNSDEEDIYPPSETERGLKMGLFFYRRWKEVLDEAGTKILVMTVRLDDTIQNEFRDNELPEESFTTKLSVRRVPVFLKKVNALLGETK